jgi:hypothetical protein
VLIAPHDYVWLVSLNTHDLTSVMMRTYHDLPDAVEAAHVWLLMLSDATEIRIDVEAHKRVARLMQEGYRGALSYTCGGRWWHTCPA